MKGIFVRSRSFIPLLPGMYIVFIIQPLCPDDVNVGAAPGKEDKKIE
jgi:hypothetical protein